MSKSWYSWWYITLDRDNVRVKKYQNSYFIVDEAHGLGVYDRRNASDMLLPGDAIAFRYSHTSSSTG
jgi:hypothetical protein